MRYADNHCHYTETFENNQHVYIFTGPCVVTRKPVTIKVPAEGLFEFLMSGWDATFSGEE